MSFVGCGDLAKFFRAFAVELQLHRPAFIAVIGMRFRHVITAEIGFLFDQQPFFARLFVFLAPHRIRLDAIVRWNHFLALIDLGQSVSVIRINQTKLELGHLRKLVARFLDFSCIKTRNLDKDPVGSLWGDDRLANAELVDAFANCFDRLIDHRFGDRALVSVGTGRRFQSNQEGSATLQVETEVNFSRTNDRSVRTFLVERRICRGKTKGRDRDRQNRSQNSPNPLAVGSKIPAEQNQQPNACEKCGCRTHRGG